MLISHVKRKGNKYIIPTPRRNYVYTYCLRSLALFPCYSIAPTDVCKCFMFEWFGEMSRFIAWLLEMVFSPIHVKFPRVVY